MSSVVLPDMRTEVGSSVPMQMFEAEMEKVKEGGIGKTATAAI